ncbi:MAG: ABC transporter permease [Hyphomonadaceae bacterium JAD_PAG50586_4]|nr:MAG: ABC transporter permease [Hyphomonadaceae bacterium JAD_PAG50586_4]
MMSLVAGYLWDRKLTTALNVLLVAIAVALLSVLLAFSTQANARFTRDAEGVDLVVGAKGSPLQLILSSVFHIDQPTGNISLESIDLLRRDPAVARVVPLALGDNFRGFRIVGTESAYLDLQHASLGDGRLNEAVGEAVIGADVARETGAHIGQRFFGSHGLGESGQEHEHQPFEVVGILQPTGRVIDRLIVTSLETVWDVHGIAHDHGEDAHAHEEGDEHAAHGHSESADDHHEHDAHEDREHDADQNAALRPQLQERGALRPEVTALLVTYRNASAAVRIPSVINRQTEMQAAVPAVETARLLSLFGASIAGAQIFGWLMASVAGLAIFVALLAAVQARAGDLALLRVMGAKRSFVFFTVLAEGLAIALIGLVAGLLLAYALLWLAVANFATLSDLGFQPFAVHPGLGLIALGVIVIAIVSALAPALRVYGGDIAKTLGRS